MNDTGKDIGCLYLDLADQLRRSIQDGDFEPGQLLGSEHELARARSISRVTVRRASELLVNEGLVERRPGKGLYVRDNSVSTRMIQVVAGNLGWDSCLQVSRGVQQAAARVGMQVQLYDAHGDADLDVNIVRQLPSTSARGAVIVSLHSHAFNEAIYELKAKGFPFVLVDQCLQDIQVPCVMADSYTGGLLAARALLERGHQRIAFIGDLIANTVADRLKGMRDAIGDAGLPLSRSMVIDLGNQNRLGDWSAHVVECISELMGRANPPTALFCSCDAVARAVYRGLTAMNIQIPGDVSVIGFDDDPLAEWLTPALTTVRQPFLKMGLTAIDLLRQRIEQPSTPAQRTLLPVELVHRDSVRSLNLN